MKGQLQETTVPFVPRGDRPVYCSDCYDQMKGGSGRGNRKPRSAAQKRKISAALKKAWAERKKAAKKSAAAA